MQRSIASSCGTLWTRSSRGACSGLQSEFRRISVSARASSEGENKEQVQQAEDDKEVPVSAKTRQANSRPEAGERRNREGLHLILAKQRREATPASVEPAATPKDASAKAKTAVHPPKGQPARKRVDLYLNETGYPQARTPMPGHENQELHSKRREHLAPHPPDAAGDALSGLVDAVAEHSKVSRPPRRRPEGMLQRPSGSRAPSHQGRERIGQSSDNPQQNSERPRLPGLRDRQSRFKANSGPGGNRSGPGGPDRRPGLRPGQRRPQRGQPKPPSVPVPVFAPAPVQVVGARSNYKFASALPSKGDIPRVQMYMHKAQWTSQRNDIEKAHKGTDSATAVLQGDWQTYISPVLKQVSAVQKNKKSKHGVPDSLRSELLAKASWSVALNPTMQLQNKMKVVEKIGSVL